MKHYVAYDYDILGRRIWHEFATKSEAIAFAEAVDMYFFEYDDKTYDTSKIDKAVGKYMSKKKKHIEVK